MVARRALDRVEKALTVLLVAGLLAWFAYGVVSMLTPYYPYN